MILCVLFCLCEREEESREKIRESREWSELVLVKSVCCRDRRERSWFCRRENREKKMNRESREKIRESREKSQIVVVKVRKGVGLSS